MITLSITTLDTVKLSVLNNPHHAEFGRVECRYAECRYAERRGTIALLFKLRSLTKLFICFATSLNFSGFSFLFEHSETFSIKLFCNVVC
jgi:hypothetical protein